ncbi:SAVMC3_10250 family protein [Streptomyces sp. NPDC005438]|uniref:SAVMC3_10250 family protein n=1 Tax=Streptomyces sp. NPDC005438 TaxID=3156880 RepID=UPI0033B41B80
MREVVYLSEGKLSGFLPEPRRSLPTIKLHAGGSMAGINVETPATDPGRELSRRLKQVEKDLERRAPSHLETDLTPGRWVQFEAPLSWITLRGRYQDLVLFVDPAPSPPETGATRRRLLLHGSARHLSGRPPTQVDGPALTGEGGRIDSVGTSFVTEAGRVLAELARTQDPLGSDRQDGDTPNGSATSLPRAGIRDLLTVLDAKNAEVNTAALMIGYARVSALLPATATEGDCLVASPLIVEYVS